MLYCLCFKKDMIKTAIVEKIENNNIVVSSLRSGACGENCSMCGGCNVQKVYTDVNSKMSVEVGDVVKIQSKTSFVLLGLFIVFLLPLILPIAFYFIFSSLNLFLGIVGSIVGFIISIILIIFFSKNNTFLLHIKPDIIEVISKK